MFIYPSFYCEYCSLEIADVARQCGAEVILRPDVISGDYASSEEVVKHVLDTVNAENIDYVVLLQPTSPLRNADHLTACIQQLLQSSSQSAVSVCRTEHHPYKMVSIENQQVVPIFNEQQFNKPRQLFTRVY